jgi:hypothetical protein
MERLAGDKPMLPDLTLEEEEIRETGQRFIAALTERDFNGLLALFQHDVRSRLLLPSGLATPLDAKGLIDKYRLWFGEATIFEVQRVDINPVGRRLGISYQILVQEADEWSVVEQHTFSSMENGRIARFDLLCTGFELLPVLAGG